MKLMGQIEWAEIRDPFLCHVNKKKKLNEERMS